jgi:hypothetical protein
MKKLFNKIYLEKSIYFIIQDWWLNERKKNGFAGALWHSHKWLIRLC